MAGLAQRGGKPGSGEAGEREVTDKILAALAGLKYGSVEIVVHDGKVVQLERREKLRLLAG